MITDFKKNINMNINEQINLIIKEELENVVNKKLDSPLNAFKNLTNANYEQLPSGKLIIGIE